MLIISAGLTPNINTNKTIATPITNITAPVVPSKFISGIATALPITPPPMSLVPSSYALFITVPNSFPAFKFPLEN